MNEPNINHWAVLTCTLANLLVGAIWYSPALFYKAWKIETGLTDEVLGKVNMIKLYSITCLFALIMSYNMAFFLGDAKTDWIWGTTAGFLTGFGWAAMIFAAIALFEQRSWKYILINGGYIVTYFTLIGLILGLWR
ncbi:MAG: DUF1761 domain-containing protein [Bacteroidetes bacterium]|nr:DUF1761 domain-containing protein [Bacteroidota bacterium]